MLVKGIEWRGRLKLCVMVCEGVGKGDRVAGTPEALYDGV